MDGRRCPRCRVVFPMVDGITFADLPAIALGKDPVVDPDAAVASHRRLIHARWARRHLEPYAWFRPFNESSRAVDRFLPLLSISLEPGAPILDLWNRTGWTGAWLAARFPESPVISVWEGDTEVLGHGGFLHWFESERRPGNLELVFASPGQALPFSSEHFGLVHGLDTLHRYPIHPLLGECLRVAAPTAPILFPHVHLTNSEPEPFFERGCSQRHGREWSSHLSTVLEGDPRRAWVLSEPAAFDRSAELVLADDPNTADYNATIVIGPREWDGIRLAPALVETPFDDWSVLTNPLARIDEHGRIAVDRSALGGTVGHMVDRHEAGVARLAAATGREVSAAAAQVAVLAEAGASVGEIRNVIGRTATDDGIAELTAHDLAICEPVGEPTRSLQRHFTTGWPERDATLAAIWAERSWRYTDHPVLITSEGDEFHLTDVEFVVDATRAWLDDRGVGAGDHVVVVAGHHPAHLLVTWAIWLSGAIVVPLNSGMAPVHLAAALDSVAAPVVFADEVGASALRHIGVDPDVVFDPLDPNVEEHESHLGVHLDAFADVAPPPIARRAPADDAAILFTSGTTGPAKGVRLSGRSLCWTGGVMADLADLRPGDRLWSVADPDTMSGLRNPCVAALRSGATIVVPVGPDGHGPLAAADLVRRSGVDVVAAGPVFISALASASTRVTSLGRLRLLLSTGGRLEPEDAATVSSAWDVPVRDYYGLTETGGVCIGRRHNDASSADGLIGRPIGAVVRIFDGEGRPVEAGDVGELAVCGPGMFSGYLSGTTGVDQRDGWIFTGDLARSHNDGSIELLGRRDSQVKTAAGRVLDGDAIAAVLHGHDGVAGVEIVPDASGRAVAHVHTVAGAGGDLEIELRSWVRDHLGADAVPVRIELRESPRRR